MTDLPDYDAMAGRTFMDFLRRVHLSTAADVPDLVAEEAVKFGASDAVVYLADYEQRYLVPLVTAQTGAREPIAIDAGPHGRAFATSSAVRADGPEPARRRLFLPLLDGTERVGTIELTVDAPTGEIPDHLLAIAERYAHLVAQTVVTKGAYGDTFEVVRRSEPMHVSAELVRGLLPPLVFATVDLVIAGLLEPAYTVGGDSFDYAVNDRTLHVAIFDAMGHGLPAAADASFAIAAYRSARRRSLNLVETYLEMDDAVQHQPSERFVTAVLARLDLDTGTLRWLNAGHPAPLLFRDGKFVKTLGSTPHTPLGVAFGGDHPVIAEDTLQPGDRILLYTDGLPEARLPDGEFFTVERLAQFVEQQAAAGYPAPETLRRLRHAILAHQHGVLQDDATAVLIEWGGGQEQALLPETV